MLLKVPTKKTRSERVSLPGGFNMMSSFFFVKSVLLLFCDFVQHQPTVRQTIQES